MYSIIALSAQSCVKYQMDVGPNLTIALRNGQCEIRLNRMTQTSTESTHAFAIQKNWG